MSSDARHGLSSFIKSSAASADEIAPENETLDLFDGDPEKGSPVGDSAFSRADGSPVRRGPGRRPGSRNVSTEKMRDFLLANYRHPLLGLFDVASTPPDQLVQLIIPRDPTTGKPLAVDDEGKLPVLSKDDMKWAFELWTRCTMEAANYVASKMPREISLSADGDLPVFQVNVHTQAGAMAGPVSASFGMQKNQVKTEDYSGGAEEVPIEEVPDEGKTDE